MTCTVVITGAGVISGAGVGRYAHHTSLRAGSVQFMSLHDAVAFLPFSSNGELLEEIGSATVCPVPMTNDELGELAKLNKKEVRRMDRHQLFAQIASAEAMQPLAGVDVSQYACIGATGGAGLASVFESSRLLIVGNRAGKKRLGPFDNLKYLPNIHVGQLTQQFGLGGPSHVHGTACAASMHAVFDLIRMIELGHVPGGLVVGTEAAITEFGIASFFVQGALGNGLAYHTDRSGFVMGEGAAALVIESYEVAKARQAPILGVITGYGESSDALQDALITDPDPEGRGAARAMRQALTMAGRELRTIDLVKTHSTATPKGDLAELQALQQLEPDPTALQQLAVTSVKSHIGHLLGAAGVAETVAMLDCMEDGMLIPTRGLNYDTIDPSCAVVEHIMGTQRRDVNTVLCNGFGFGGTNASMVVSAHP